MGKSHIFKSLGNFTIEKGYVYYKRLDGDINMMGYKSKIDEAFKNEQVFDTTSWEKVATTLYNTGIAEQKKEITFFEKIFHVTISGITEKDYYSYINTVNQLLGLKKKYGAQLKEVIAQSRDKANHRAAGAFRYFESRLNTCLTKNIRQTFNSLSEQEVLNLTDQKIKNILDNMIQVSIEEALTMIQNQTDFYQGKEIQIWQEAFEGLKQLNSITKNNLIETIISRYKLHNITENISSWLRQTMQTKNKKDYKIKGLHTKIKENIYSGKANSSIEGLLEEYVPSIIASAIGGSGTVIGSKSRVSGGKGSRDNSAADSVLFFSTTQETVVPDFILENFASLNSADIEDAANEINKLTNEVLDNLDDHFIVYESSKMYRLNGGFSTRGFGGRSGNLSNLGEVLKQYGNSQVSQLTANIANVLYQTMKGAILEGKQDYYIEKTKQMIIETITASLFDDIEFQGINSKNDHVIHMLDLEAVQIPLSIYCLKLSEAISKAIDKFSSDLLQQNNLIRQYVSVKISGLPQEISFPEPLSTKEFGEKNGFKYPQSVYEAWRQQKKDVEEKGKFTIHFLKNFNNILNNLVKDMDFRI